ncbi:hypothetical protein FF38_03001 [Lucilia cuprina]|uniref:Uncharacterized protein n=1 Tax=Lucilia cuprina TaxID=7375 RepID=A0A0L0BY16_LUCCU|nr:hypothetical protein FF38_03001 [Lucilia cuprina]
MTVRNSNRWDVEFTVPNCKTIIEFVICDIIIMSEYGNMFVRGFSLSEALALIEDDDMDVDNITIFPPNNACGDITDEDSGDEYYVDINNLPSSVMQNEVEFVGGSVLLPKKKDTYVNTCRIGLIRPLGKLLRRLTTTTLCSLNFTNVLELPNI